VQIAELLKPIMDELRMLRERQSVATYMTIREACDYSRLSDDTIRRLIDSGRLDAYRPVGGIILIARRQLDHVITSSKKRKSTRGTSRTSKEAQA